MIKLLKTLCIISLLTLIFLGCSNNISNKSFENSINESINDLPHTNNIALKRNQIIDEPKDKKQEKTTEKNKFFKNIKSPKNTISDSNTDSGLLLGLKKVYPESTKPPKYETVWISKKGNDIDVFQKEDLIITPYKMGFYKLENETSHNAKIESKVESDFSSKYVSKNKFDFTNIISLPINMSKKMESTRKNNFIEDDNIENKLFSYINKTSEILYAGNNYVLIREKSLKANGTKFSTKKYRNVLFDVSSLEYENITKNILNFLSEDTNKAIDSYKKIYNRILEYQFDSYGSKYIILQQFIDDNNLILQREKGKWTVKVPLSIEFTHPGNESYHIYEKDYLELSSILPWTITSHDDLVIPFSNIKENIEGALDAVSSPDGSMLVVLTEDHLKIFLNPTEDIDIEDYSISIAEGESIILNQWATGSYVDKWTEEFKIHLNY